MSSERKKRVLAFTSTRSDYDLLSYIYRIMHRDPGFDLKLLVSGMHLSKAYGYSYQNILKDGFDTLPIETLIDSDSRAARIKTASLLLQNSIHTIIDFDPELILFAGDREDAMMAALLAGYLKIPSAHFFGGDHTTDGNIDNPIRHASSKMASVHFVMCMEHENRLLALGERKERIFNVGSPAIDKLLEEKMLPRDEVFKYLKIKAPKKYAVLIFHPILGDEKAAGSQFELILNNLKSEGYEVLCGTPNVDSGNHAILEVIEKNKGEDWFHAYTNLPRNEFVNLLRYTNLLIGNSSLGILEAATLKIPVINVGKRQVGRMHAGNVVFCDENSISAALKKITTKDYLDQLATCTNPYGVGDSSIKVVEIIKKLELNNFISKTEDPMDKGLYE